MKQAILFDMDGVLIDGSVGMEDTLRRVIKENGLRELSPSETGLFFKLTPLPKSFSTVFGMNDADVQKYTDIFRGIYTDGECFKTRLYDGIVETLDKLRSRGYMLGIATFKREDYARKIAAKLKLLDRVSAFRAADANNKLTKADIIARCLNDMKIEPSDAVYVGDTQNDFDSANLLGMNFIASTYGFGFTKDEKFDNAQPIAVIDGFAKLTELFAESQGQLHKQSHSEGSVKRVA